MIKQIEVTKTGRILYQCSVCHTKFINNDPNVVNKPCISCARIEEETTMQDTKRQELDEFWDYTNDTVNVEELCREVIRLRDIVEELKLQAEGL